MGRHFPSHIGGVSSVTMVTEGDAWENFRGRFNRGFGVEAEGVPEGAACPVHTAARASPGGGA